MRIFILLMLLLLTLRGCANAPTSIMSETSTPDSVILIFDANGGSGELPGETSYTADESITLPDNNESDFDREGYRLTGWKTREDDYGTDFALGQTIIYDEFLDILGKDQGEVLKVTLYARWEKTYSVIYNGNGAESGTVPVGDKAYIEGETVTIPDLNFTRDGYRLIAWNTEADGNGSDFFPGDSLSIGTTDITLYARWEKTYSVIYNGNGAEGGEVPVDETVYIEGETLTVADNSGNLTKATENFDSWNTDASGDGIKLSPGDIFAMGSSDITLYAQWTSKPEYWVRYDANGGEGTDALDHLTVEGSTVTVASGDAFQKEEYKMTSWNTTIDGTGKAYTPGDTFTMGAADITLYAQWEKAYSVIYNGNGAESGSVPVDEIAYIEGETLTVADNSGNLTKTTENFDSWNTVASGDGIKLSPGQTFNMGTEDITLYAQWTNKPEYWVRYDANGGEGTDDTLNHKAVEGSTVIVRSTDQFQKERYRMTGWNSEYDGTGTPYTPGGTFTMGNSDITLYAQYDLLYEISFDGNEADEGIPPATIYVVAEEYFTIDATTDLEKLGYTFPNWNTDASGGGQDYWPGKSYITNTDLTLYAQWTAIDYTLSYNPNEADGGYVPDPVTVWGSDGEDSLEVAGNTGDLVKNEYLWEKWNTDVSGDGQSYWEGDTIAMNYSDQILYTFWQRSVTQVSTGYHHTMILKSDNSLWATGRNNYGQLGDGTTIDRKEPVVITDDVVAVAAGFDHTMILKSGGSLWAMGNNEGGQLGLDSTAAVYTPEKVDVTGDVVAVATGFYHTMILKSDGSLWATGSNNYGQLGLGDTTEDSVSTPKYVTGDVAAVATGAYHTMILKSNGSLWAMGNNEDGQLGDGTTNDSDSPVAVENMTSDVTAVATGAYHTMILKNDGSLWAMGSDGDGQLGNGDDSTDDLSTPEKVMDGVAAVSAGPYHTMILKSDNSLWATGKNFVGQLGDGTAINSEEPVAVVGMTSDVAAASGGIYHTMILKSDGSLWATGYNQYGQLGDGSTSNRYTPGSVIPLVSDD